MDEDAKEQLPQSFICGSEEFTASDVSLQDAFLKYKKLRQKELKKNRRVKQVKNETVLKAMANPDKMWALRMKFLDQLRKYFGVPYAKRYWKADEPEFSEKIFLDCCGLIRRAMRDMRKDFGFKIGPWNQSYMYDTLPITIEEKDMKPGDLVFISAIYHSPKSKKQPHNMTHVEVWLGDGPKTIGSRWHRGKVQIFDNYAFEPKSYHSEQYHFKSIDTWLMGICRSHCKQHPWKTRAENFKPSKKSIFAIKDEKKQVQVQEPAAEETDDEAASDTDSEIPSYEDTSAPVTQSDVWDDTVADNRDIVSALSTLSCPPTFTRDKAQEEEGSYRLKLTNRSDLTMKINEICTKDNFPIEKDSQILDQIDSHQSTDIKCLKASSFEQTEFLCPKVYESNIIYDEKHKMWVIQSNRVNADKPDDSSVKNFDTGAQTGSEQGKYLHTLGADRWCGASNVQCYASMSHGAREVSVQIKSPDLISLSPSSSSSSLSSGDNEDNGYSAEEQSFSDSCQHSAGAKKPVSISNRNHNRNNSTAGSNSSSSEESDSDVTDDLERSSTELLDSVLQNKLPACSANTSTDRKQQESTRAKKKSVQKKKPQTSTSVDGKQKRESSNDSATLTTRSSKQSAKYIPTASPPVKDKRKSSATKQMSFVKPEPISPLYTSDKTESDVDCGAADIGYLA